MLQKKRTLMLMMVICFFSMALSAQELWINQSSDDMTREFITVESEVGNYELTQYQQTQGEYQDLKLKKSFNSLEAATQYIEQNFKSFIPTEELEFWPTMYEKFSVAETEASNDIWTATKSWSPEWEQKYAQWLSLEVTPDFFIRYNIAVDCADAAIGFRWIFARINGLPAANTQAGGGNLFGHFSMKREWAKYPTSPYWYQDQRFKAALNYAMDSTSTRSILLYDGFPVALNTKGLMAGSFIVSYINNTGHLRTITENHFNDPRDLPVYTYSATSPREVRSLYREPLVDQAWPIKNAREIMAFRWPVRSQNRWILNSKTNDYRYSTEQFSTTLPPRYYSFIHYVLENTNPNYEPRNLVATGIQDVTGYINLRIKIVNDGYNYCSRHSCPRGSSAYDDWSTPNRDRNMRMKFLETENLLKTFDPVYPGLIAHWNSSLAEEKVRIQGVDVTLERIRYLFLNGLVSSDPNDSINKRWGF